MASTTIELPVVNADNAEIARIQLPDVFSGTVNDAVLFEQVLAQLASRRRGTASTKTRGEVRGGGKKPWKQKGTGRARAGSIRSPIWRGGGTTFGPRPRSYAYRLPRKTRYVALRSALSQKARDGEVRVIDKLEFAVPKTKDMRALLERIGVAGSVLIVVPENDRNVELSARNLPNVQAMPVAGLNVYDILRHKNLLVVQGALDAIQGRVTR